jgi:hypothetical protein
VQCEYMHVLLRRTYATCACAGLCTQAMQLLGLGVLRDAELCDAHGACVADGLPSAGAKLHLYDAAAQPVGEGGGWGVVELDGGKFELGHSTAVVDVQHSTPQIATYHEAGCTQSVCHLGLVSQLLCGTQLGAPCRQGAGEYGQAQRPAHQEFDQRKTRLMASHVLMWPSTGGLRLACCCARRQYPIHEQYGLLGA